MEVKLINKDNKKGTIIFSVSDTDHAYMNTLRRTILDNVPVMAIDEVEFRKNNSILYDEIIAHRLGLLPLSTDLKSYNLISECKCKGAGCARCTLKLTLSVKGPKMVLASDIKTKDPKVKPVFPSTPIVKLLKNQELKFEATACLGVGKEHSKFIPGLAWYTYKPIVTINNSSKKLAEYKSKYPPQIFNKDGNIDKNLIIYPNLVDACAGICDEIIKIEYDESSFLFYIETWGQLDCKQILVTAIEQLNKKFDNANAAFKAIK